MGICPYCELDESVCDRSLGWPQRARCWESAWNLRGIELSATRSKLVLSNHEATALRAENARLREALAKVEGACVEVWGDYSAVEVEDLPPSIRRVWSIGEASNESGTSAALDAKEGE